MDRQKEQMEQLSQSPFIRPHFREELKHRVLRKARQTKFGRGYRILYAAAIFAFAIGVFAAGSSVWGDWAHLNPASYFGKRSIEGQARSEYYDYGKLRFAVYPDPFLAAGNEAGYIFHFTAPFEQLHNRTLSINAVHVKSGLKVTAVPAAQIVEPSSRYQGLERFTATFGLPISGMWKYEVELDGKPYGDVVLAVKEPSWEVSQLFRSGNYMMRGIEHKVGFIDAGFRAGAPQKYMWHFWGAKELDGKFVVRAVKQGEERIIELFSADSIAGEMNGADRTAVTMMTLPEQGRWRLLPYVGERMLDSIVVDVK